MLRNRVLLALLLVAACSKKKADPAPEPTPAAPAPVAQPVTPPPETKPAPPAENLIPVPENRIEYDLPMVGAHKSAFAVSFALLHLGNPDTGQGDLVVFGPDVKPGDSGGASDWKDICSTRLNAFPFGAVDGFRIYLLGIKELPAAGPSTRLDSSKVTFDLQGNGWGLSNKDMKDHAFESDVRLVKSDGKDAELEVRIQEPGKDGSVRGRVHAKICPAS